MNDVSEVPTHYEITAGYRRDCDMKGVIKRSLGDYSRFNISRPQNYGTFTNIRYIGRLGILGEKRSNFLGSRFDFRLDDSGCHQNKSASIHFIKESSARSRKLWIKYAAKDRGVRVCFHSFSMG